MPKYSAHTRFLALFLLLSFILLSTAVLSIFVGIKAADSVSASQAEKTGGSAAVSLFVINFNDFLDAENLAYKIGLGQTFQSRKILAERNGQIFGALIILCAILIYSTLSSGGTISPFNSTKIAEFIHAKDGMI